MTEAKTKRLIVASTVGAVLLVIILVSIMLYQLITINNERKSLAELNEKIAYYEQLIEEGEDTFEVRKLRWWIEHRALELGYEYKGSEGLKG